MSYRTPPSSIVSSEKNNDNKKKPFMCRIGLHDWKVVLVNNFEKYLRFRDYGGKSAYCNNRRINLINPDDFRSLCNGCKKIKNITNILEIQDILQLVEDKNREINNDG